MAAELLRELAEDRRMQEHRERTADGGAAAARPGAVGNRAARFARASARIRREWGRGAAASSRACARFLGGIGFLFAVAVLRQSSYYSIPVAAAKGGFARAPVTAERLARAEIAAAVT